MKDNNDNDNSSTIRNLASMFPKKENIQPTPEKLEQYQETNNGDTIIPIHTPSPSQLPKDVKEKETIPLSILLSGGWIRARWLAYIMTFSILFYLIFASPPFENTIRKGSATFAGILAVVVCAVERYIYTQNN